MSTFKHRQPIISWSSVVLLSTLLLSPMTAASVLHVLAQAFPHAFSAASEEVDLPTARTADEQNAATPVGASPTTPRRANDEQEALRQAVARASRLRAVRLDTDPRMALCDLSARVSVTVRVPVREIYPVADPGAAIPVPNWPATSDGLARTRVTGPTSPRAPPFA